jgi:nitrate reductase delta subunit
VSAVASRPEARRALAQAFAAVLSYPYDSPSRAARLCAAELGEHDADAQELLLRFAAFVDATPVGQLQEAFTRAFDLDTMSRSEPTCYPYVGHYLFDESHKRGAFILELRKRFRASGFSDESDLADHLVVLLRFLSVCEDDELAEELVADAILPALGRMAVAAAGDGAEARRRGRDEYLDVLRALERAFAAGRETDQAEILDTEAEREWLRDRDSLGISRDWCGH